MPKSQPEAAVGLYKEFKLDPFPETIPETQLDPPSSPTIAIMPKSARSFFTMTWEASGTVIHLNLNLSLDEILETLQDIGLKDRLD